MLNSYQLKALFESFLTAIVASVASSNELDVDQANELISQVSDFAVDRVVEVRVLRMFHRILTPL